MLLWAVPLPDVVVVNVCVWPPLVDVTPVQLRAASNPIRISSPLEPPANGSPIISYLISGTFRPFTPAYIAGWESSPDIHIASIMVMVACVRGCCRMRMFRHLPKSQRMLLFTACCSGGMLGPGAVQEDILYGLPCATKKFMRVCGLAGSVDTSNGPA